jgi:hypothetical protein
MLLRESAKVASRGGNYEGEEETMKASLASSLALQLPFFEMGALSDRLVSSTPE